MSETVLLQIPVAVPLPPARGRGIEQLCSRLANPETPCHILCGHTRHPDEEVRAAMLGNKAFAPFAPWHAYNVLRLPGATVVTQVAVAQSLYVGTTMLWEVFRMSAPNVPRAVLEALAGNSTLPRDLRAQVEKELTQEHEKRD